MRIPRKNNSKPTKSGRAELGEGLGMKGQMGWCCELITQTTGQWGAFPLGWFNSEEDNKSKLLSVIIYLFGQLASGNKNENSCRLYQQLPGNVFPK